MKKIGEILLNVATKALLLWAVAMVLFSCDLEVDPRQTIRTSEALDNPQRMEQALNSVYGRLRSTDHYGRDMFAKSDALSDVGYATGNSGRLVPENDNVPNAHFSSGFWQNSYAAISELNLILDQIEKGVTGASETELSRWEGEAKFLRALYFFDLVKVYSYIPTAIYQEGVVDQGGIPMPLNPIYIADVAYFNQYPRATLSQNYSQIISDLNEAVSLLQNSSRQGAQFASAGAALGLLSRVALYNGNWQTALNASNLALSSSNGELLSGEAYINGWRATVNPESMFEVRIQSPEESLGQDVSLQASFTTILDLEDKNARGGWGDLIPSPIVLDLFGLEPVQIGNPATDNNNWDVTRNQDVRAMLYTTGNNQRFARRQIECMKFIGKNGFRYGDNIPVIRKSEMLLNKAEALYHLGREIEALVELNTFKALRGNNPVSLDRQTILEEILLERFKEFAFEGQRFFDLKRYGRDIDKRSYLGPNDFVAFEDFRILAPIPRREVELNGNLNQNRGY
ncbi:RagB/SusD family nutrient uptake outer membrane protein [Shivajiella indica]|uniref:RagB/SusD family nutrient uptake outer membrane protein n=1 Tax=Shivajiella indica TaxID=872115 RepID=A0ABW5B474_9BACT